MVKVSISKNQIETNSAIFETQELANTWLQREVSNNSFGKNERWVREGQEDISNALETRIISGPDSDITEYKLSAEYTITQTDISAQIQQEQTNQQALKYLVDTDWYVLRSIDDPTKPVPPDIKAARAVARASIVH